MTVSLCYAVLYIITIYLAVISWLILKKTDSLLLIIPIVVGYFWSIFGAWSWIPMKLRGEYDYYEFVMYTVDIDWYYLQSLALYSLFLFLLSLCLYRIACTSQSTLNKRIEFKKMLHNNIARLDNNWLYYAIIYTLLFVFVYFSSSDIILAARDGVSAYNLSRFESSLGGIGSLIMFSGDTFLYLSIPLLFVKKSALYKMKIILPIALYFIVNLLLGNRNTLLCGLLMGVIIISEINGIRGTFTVKNILIITCALVAIQYISFIRGVPITKVLAGEIEFNFGDVLNSTSKSQEKYAAHISMYGVLKKNIPFTYGSSVLFLLSTLIPSFLGIRRPNDIYHYFVTQTLGAKPEIGVSLHHATGWYLNFGTVGVILGALLWGLVTKCLYSRKESFVFFVGSTIFSAASIQMIRGGGLDCYKGVLLLDTIVPMVIISLCLKKKRNDKSIIQHIQHNNERYNKED